MSALRYFGWLVLFLGLYAAFFCLFENGPKGFAETAKMRFEQAKTSVGMNKTSKPSPITVTPVATPVPVPAPAQENPAPIPAPDSSEKKDAPIAPVP